MSLRIRLADTAWFPRLALLGWQIGLGWLLGRWFVLLTTLDASGGRRHTVIPFAFAAGDLFVSARGDEPWIEDAARKPLAMAQTHPGPLGVRITRAASEDERRRVDAVFDRYAPDLLDPAAGAERFVLAATGDPTPTLVPPDHVWVWPAAGVVLWVARTVRRRS